MLVGCGSASVTSSSIRASDAAVPTAAVVDCLSTNHWVRPQLGLVPEKRHQLPGKPLLIFEQWDQQVRRLRSRSAPQLLTPFLPPSLRLPLFPFALSLNYSPVKKRKKKKRKAFLQMRRRRGGLIRDRLSRARECAEPKKTKPKKKNTEKGAQRQNRDSGVVMTDKESAGATLGSQGVLLPAQQITTGVLGKLRPGDVRAPPFGSIAHVWSSNAAGRPVQSVTHVSVSYSSPGWQKWLI